MFKRRNEKSRREYHLLKLAYRCQSAEELCEKAVSLVGCPVYWKPCRVLLLGKPGFSAKKASFYLIGYKPTTYLSIQHTILHELGHIVLGHHEARDTEEIDIEQEAEDFGYQLLVAVHGVGAFLSTSKNPSVAARYESLMSL
ncbi:hypothetical protein IH992_06500 [Candidatus Poribacteria bacterium]|nr:hypothetical protein [Candidatus Poribacteria bacterium]